MTEMRHYSHGKAAMIIAALAFAVTCPLILIGEMASRNQRPIEEAAAIQQQWATVKVESALLYPRIMQEFDRMGLARSYPGLTFSTNHDGSPILHYHTKACQVHTMGLDGSASKTARSEEGPIGDGLLLTFSASPLSGIEQLVYVSGIVPPPMNELATNESWVHRVHLEKLWLEYYCGVTIPDRKIRFFVFASFNENTSLSLIEAVYTSVQRALASEKMGDLDP
jgi:hypothetical protein